MNTTWRNPAEKQLKQPILLSLITAGLFAVNSFFNLLARASIYPSEELITAFIPNDIINLFLGVPLMVFFALRTLQKRRIAFSTLAALLLFVLYNEIAYLVAVRNPFSIVLNALIAISAVVALVLLLGQMKAVGSGETNTLFRHTGGYAAVLITMGAIFIARSVMDMLSMSNGETEMKLSNFGVDISDLLLCAVWIISGIMLIRKTNAGQFMGLISLLNGAILFLALLLFLVLQPLIFSAPFSAADILVIFLMSLVFLIPCAIVLKKNQS